MSDEQTTNPVLTDSPPTLFPPAAPFTVIMPTKDWGTEPSGAAIIVAMTPQIVSADGEGIALAEGRTQAECVVNAHRIAQALNGSADACSLLRQIPDAAHEAGVTLPQEVAFLIEAALSALEPQTIVADGGE